MRGASTRLFLLSELADRGEAHGHDLRREAMLGKTELWAEVGVGSIYSTLRRLADEGLIRVVRTERSGQMPERTLYAVSDEGRRELAALRETMLREVVVRADPFDLALACSAGMQAGELVDIVDDRVGALENRISTLEHLRSSAAEHLDERDHVLFEHSLYRLRADVAWHQHVRTAISNRQEESS